MADKKLFRVIKALLVSVCILLCSATAVACKSCKKNDTDVESGEFPSITFTSAAEAYVGEYYKLEMVLPQGVTAEIITAKSSWNNSVELDENFGFTPREYGFYDYSVTAKRNDDTKLFTFRVSVIDKDAPQIVRAPQNVAISCGLYNDFESDISTMEVVCKNEALVEYLNIRVVKIEGENLSVEDDEGLTSYLFDETGEYTLTVKAETATGKFSLCTYKITVSDDRAPEISVSDKVFVWVRDGKIAIPQPRVYDFSSYELAYTVKKNGAVQSVSDGFVSAEAGDVFEVVYTATDGGSNSAEAVCEVHALREGTLIDGSDASFTSVIYGRNGLCEYVGGTILQSNGFSDTYTFANSGFGYEAVEAYKSVRLTVLNKQSATVNAGVYLHFGALKTKIGSVTLQSGENSVSLPVSRTLGLSGISLEVSSSQRILLELEKIDLSGDLPADGANETLKANPAYSFDLGNEKYYDFKAYGGEKFARKSTSAFGAEKSALYSAVGASQFNSCIFADTSAENVSNVNYAEILIYSEKTANVTVGLILNGNRRVQFNATLQKGVNAVKGYLEDLVISVFNGLSLKNNDGYANVLYVSCVNFYNVQAVADEEIFTSDSAAVTVAYGEKLVVPEIVDFTKKAVSSLDIRLYTGGSELKSGLSVGEEINLYGEETGEGTYILRYTVIDVFGGEHTKEIGITAKGKEFYAEIKIDKDYYAGDRIDLPDPEMSGALYESHASEVRVNKYYRVEGGTKWLSADEGFTVHSNAYVDLKYSVYADGVANVIAEKTIYVHANGVTFDYEEMADGSHLGVADDYDPNNPTPLSSNWSHDGKYSILMKSHKYYDIFAGMVFGGKGIQLDKTCNAIIFYAYSDKDVSGETSLGVLTENGCWSEAYVRILKGKHKYVVKLPKEFSSFTKFGGQIKRGEDFYIDSVTFDKLVDFDVPEQSEIVVGGKEFTVNKPVGITYSAAAFTEKQMSAATAWLDVTSENGTKSTYQFTDDYLKLTLAAGSYKLAYRVEIGGFEEIKERELLVTNLPVRFFEMQTGYDRNKEYTLKMPETEGITAEITASYRLAGTAQWTNAENGKIKFTAAGSYEVKFTVSADGKSDEMVYNVVVRDDATVMDFETDESGAHYGWIDKVYEEIASDTSVSSEWAADGKYSLKIVPIMDSWSGFDYNGAGKKIELAKPCDFVELWVKTERSIPGWEIELRGGGVTAHGTANLTAGAHKYVIQLDKAIQTIDGYMIFRIQPGYGTIYIDAVKMFTAEVEYPEMPSEVEVDKEVLIDEPVVRDGTVIAKYKNEGDTEYTIAEKVGGKYSMIFGAVGEGEIVFEINTNGYTIEKSFRITVKNIAVQWATVRSGLNAGETLTIQKPISDGEISVHTYYRAKGSDSETEISESAGVYLLTFERTGDYIVRQTVTRNGRTAEKEYAVYVRTAESIFDAETDESGNHHGVGAKIADYASCFEDSISEEWSANGRYSMMIKPTNNAWAGYDYSADPKTLAYATNKFEIWVKTDVAVAGWALGIDDGTGWKSATLDLEAGAHKYVFTLNASVTRITKFYMRANGAAGTAEYTGVFYIDGLTALYDEIRFPSEVPAKAVVGETIMLGDALAPSGSKITVKWCESGSESYTVLTKENGAYRLKLEKYGTVKLVYEVEYNGEVKTNTYYIYVDDEAFTGRY